MAIADRLLRVDKVVIGVEVSRRANDLVIALLSHLP